MKSFTAILEDVLQAPQVHPGGDHRPCASVFLPSDDASPPIPGSAAERTQALYRELMDETAPAPSPPRPAPQPARAPDPQSDLETLRRRVAAARSQTELAALRREFARRHHPDLAPEHLSSLSAQAMREANALIDVAARKLG